MTNSDRNRKQTLILVGFWRSHISEIVLKDVSLQRRATVSVPILLPESTHRCSVAALVLEVVMDRARCPAL